MIKILETPRDAMQGIAKFIPTEDKIRYINSLLEVGFDSLDFGSFVSSKAIPQMRDSYDVITNLNTANSKSEILSTIGSLNGAIRSFEHDNIDGVIFPFSISETFLKKNIRSDFQKSIDLSKQLIDMCNKEDRVLRMYITMAFGNPYGEEWSTEILSNWVGKLLNFGVKEIILGDTVGSGTPEDIAASFDKLKTDFPELNPGVHIHTTPENWKSKVSSAYDNGCRTFDTVLGGLGGCPMSGEDLLGNLNTLDLIEFADSKNELVNVDREKLLVAMGVGNEVFK